MDECAGLGGAHGNHGGRGKPRAAAPPGRAAGPGPGHASRRGVPVPEGWHVALFGPLARQSGLGPDGHAALGRIPAAGAAAAAHVRGAPHLVPWRRSPSAPRSAASPRIAAITPKQGRSGRMIFVTVRHGIESDGPSNAWWRSRTSSTARPPRPAPPAAAGATAGAAAPLRDAHALHAPTPCCCSAIPR